MKIVYYRRIADRKITRHHELSPSMTEEGITQALHDYNSNPVRNEEAFVIDVEPDSLIEYLIKKSKERVLFAKSNIEDALEALDNAQTAIQLLDCE